MRYTVYSVSASCSTSCCTNQKLLKGLQQNYTTLTENLLDKDRTKRYSAYRIVLSSSLPLGISANGGTSSSNSNGLHNQSPSTSLSYFVHPLSATPGGNISRVVNSNNKVITIGFDDGRKGQITHAKPILDKYGFKASFFIVCNYANAGDIGDMNWHDIATLEKDGMDIESHSMTHPPNLNTLNQKDLDYEIGGSKQCLASHRYNSTIFAYPHDSGSNDPAVIRTVAKYYNIGRPRMAPFLFLNCNGFRNHPQTDCRTYGPNGELNYVLRCIDMRLEVYLSIW